MNEIIKFRKSLQDRFNEYQDLLASEKQSVPLIEKYWCYRLELNLIETNGFHAVWSVPKILCQLYKLQFPVVMLIHVQHVDCKLLTAKVTVVAMKDKIAKFPTDHEVKVIELYPTKFQEKNVDLCSIYSIADTIDEMRFFYNRILMPWDCNDEDPMWLTKNLEARLNLYYDILNGSIPRQIAEDLNLLIQEARELYEGIEDIQFKVILDQNDADLLVSMKSRLVQIKNQFEKYENPVCRKALYNNMMELYKRPNPSEPLVWIIIPNVFSQDDRENFIQEIIQKEGDQDYNICDNLVEALRFGEFNDTFILKESQHLIKNSGAIEGGGALKGIGDRNAIIILSKNEKVMLDCKGKNTTLENVTIDTTCSKFGIVVRQGTLTIKNCKIICDSEKPTKQGITVHTGSKVEIMDSEISGFNTAVSGFSGSAIVLSNCKISSVKVGLHVFDNCNLFIHDTLFSDCQDYGVCFETEFYPAQCGDFTILENIMDIDIENLKGVNNSENAKIHKKPNILDELEDAYESVSDELEEAKDQSDSENDDDELNQTVQEILKNNQTKYLQILQESILE